MSGALIRCSEAAIRINCAGSVYLSQTVPAKEDTEFTREGTIFHDWAAKTVLHGPEILKDCPDKEMIFHAANYGAFVKKLDKKVGGFDEAWVEQKVHYNKYMFGTADFCALYANRSRLILLDAKYGSGVGVLATENFQLIAYLLCVIAHHKLQNLEKATMIIYQPRARDGEGNVRHWTIYGQDIDEWQDRFDLGIHDCVEVAEGRAVPTYNAGSHCFWCVAKPVCKAFSDNVREESMGLIAPLPEASLPALPDPNRLTLDQISKLLAIEPRVKELYKSLKPFASSMIMQGNNIPGFKMVEGKSNRKWIADEKKVEVTLKALGATDIWKKKLVGLGEIEKQIGKGKINSITVKPPGKPTLAAEEDKRPAIVFDKGADLLDALDTEESSEIEDDDS